MIKNYIKITWRNLSKHKLYSAINIGGFALSIAACMLIAIYINHEMSFDRSYPDADRIFRVVGEFNIEGNELKGTSTPAPMAGAVKADFPEVELAGRLMPNSLFYGAGSNQVTVEGHPESVYEEGFTYIDQELLDILQPPMVYGVRENVLDQPNSIVITHTKAEKFFPGQNPVGRVLFLNDNRSSPYTITGVIEDFPSTSHLNTFDFLLTLSGVEFGPGEQENWRQNNYVVYLKLHSSTDVDSFQKKMNDQILGAYLQDAAGSIDLELVLQPVGDIHLYSYDIGGSRFIEYGDIRIVRLFGGIAFFILLIACINFINLSTAKSANRAREIGVRKVAGSDRGSLITQFLTESTLISFLSFMIGMALAHMILPLFNTLSGKELLFLWNGQALLITVISAVTVGLVAGLYPAVYLSGFNPIGSLKGDAGNETKKTVFRNGLVTFQFMASCILIIGTLIINNQMQYILNTNVGFDKDQVVVIQGTHTLGEQIHTFREELTHLPQVKSATIGDYLPVRFGGVKRNMNQFAPEGKIQEEFIIGGQFWRVDEDYLNTLGIALRAGRNFSEDMATDAQSMIINESAVEALQLDDPVGARIVRGGETEYTVIGIVEDFHFESLESTVEPLFMVLGESPTMVSVKVSGNDMTAALESITTLWKAFAPQQAIRYTFLDESYANLYADVQRTNYIFLSFALLAVFIACLGLFGLAAFSTEQRTKEIGVRKVLGASVGEIVTLLNKDLLKLVLLGFVIAVPIAWYAMNRWLEDFAYRIEIGPGVFLLAGLAAMVIALATVSWQSVKAALMNPVNSLRSE